MKPIYHKRLFALVISIAIGLFLIGSIIFADSFCSPTFRFNLSILGTWVFSAACIASGVMWLIMAHRYKRGTLDAHKDGKSLGIFGFVLTFAMMVWGFCSIFITPKMLLEWLYFIMMAVNIIVIVLLAIFIHMGKKTVQSEDSRFSIYQAYASSLICMMSFQFISAAVASPKLLLLSDFIMAISDQNPDPNVYFPYLLGFMGFILFILILSVATVLIIFYFSFAELISYLENTPIQFKRGLTITKDAIVKYDIDFWASNLVTLILGIVAFGSMLTLGKGYLGLVILYGSLLLILVPSHIWKQIIERKYKGDDYLIFKKKYVVTIYMSVLILALGVLCTIFGAGATEKFEADYGPLMIFAVFIPYSIIKIVLGIIGYLAARKKGDPFYKVVAYVNIITAVYVVAGTMFMVASLYGAINASTMVWIVVGSAVYLAVDIFAVVISIVTMVESIRGIQGKLKNEYQKHEEAIKKTNTKGFKKIVHRADKQSDDDAVDADK